MMVNHDSNSFWPPEKGDWAQLKKVSLFKSEHRKNQQFIPSHWERLNSNWRRQQRNAMWNNTPTSSRQHLKQPAQKLCTFTIQPHLPILRHIINTRKLLHIHNWKPPTTTSIPHPDYPQLEGPNNAFNNLSMCKTIAILEDSKREEMQYNNHNWLFPLERYFAPQVTTFTDKYSKASMLSAARLYPYE